MRRTWLVSCCLASATSVGAQLPARTTQSLRHMQHASWTAENGMTFSPRGALVQTPDGYLWMGRKDALVRFDGVRFASIDSATSPVLRSDSSGLLRPLLVDRDGVLWIARADGALIHYRQGGFALAVPADPKRQTPAAIVQDRTGRIWFNINFALYTMDGGRIGRPRLPAGVPDSGVLSVVPDTGSGVWIGTVRQGLWHVVGNRAERVVLPPGRTPVARPFLQSSDGRLWIWGPEMLMVGDGTRWSTVLADGVNQVAPFTVIESRDHDIWIGTQSDGLLRISGGTTEHYSKRHGLADVVVRDVLVDREQNVWVVSDWALERFRTAPFTTLGAADGVPFETPSKIAVDRRDGLWVHSMGDLRLFHASHGIIAGDTGSVRWSEARFANRGAHSPLGGAHGGGVLVWSDTGGVGRVTNGVTTTLATASQLDAMVVRALYEDTLGNVWAGWNPRGPGPGFARLKDGVVTPVRIEPPGQRGNVSAIADDGRGHLWVNNTARPAVYKLVGDSVVARLDSAAGIHAVVTVIVPQGPDTLWMLTNRASLLRVIGRSVTRVRFVGDDDLLTPPWSSLARDDETLWIATSGGIARLGFAALHATADGRGPIPRPRIYDASDGLINGHTPFTVVNAVAATDNGRMWFSTSAGLAVYDPRFDRPDTIPMVHIEEIIAAGQRVSPASAMIPPQPDRIEIHFTAISLGAPEKVRLQYMLEGADHDWVTADAQRTATYTQLRAGGYRFRVRAWNGGSESSMSETELSLRVAPAWFEAAWFRVLAVLAAIAVGPFVVFQVLHRRSKRRETELHARFDAALDERNRIARELHDTLLQGFGGITLQLQMVAHTLATSPPKAAERLDGILRLADDTLVDARQMIWDLRAPELEYQDLSDALASAARDAIVDAPIELRFSVRGEERRLPPIVESTALRVGREAATNAVRHARPSRIEIELAYGERQLGLSVRDDGSGFPLEAGRDQRLNGHWGIAGMRERAVRAGGAVDITSTTGRGTTVSLRLPVA